MIKSPGRAARDPSQARSTGPSRRRKSDSTRRWNGLRPRPILRLHDPIPPRIGTVLNPAGCEYPFACGGARAVDGTEPIEYRGPSRARSRQRVPQQPARRPARADQEAAEAVGLVDQRERDRGRFPPGKHHRERVGHQTRIRTVERRYLAGWIVFSSVAVSAECNRLQRKCRRSGARASALSRGGRALHVAKIEGRRFTHVAAIGSRSESGTMLMSPVDAWTIATAA